tara:strand:+ start:636 stop:1175 length:540 start_codon:yes stop_codon:yes gene_type:complete
MGGFGGGNSTGGGGGVGPAGRKSSGSYGTKRDAQRASSRNEGRKAAKAVGDFIRGGGVTGAVIRAIKKSAKKSKQNVLDYEGQAAGVTPERRPTAPNRDEGGNKNQGIELAKTASTEPVTKRVQQAAVDAAPTGPTEVEMPVEESEAERLLKIKRKGRRATILNVPDDELTLSKKVLLG